MTRRSHRFLSATLLVLALAAVGAFSTDLPAVLQITDPSYSATEQALITQSVSALAQVLQERYPIPSFRLSARGWQARDYALFAAGRIEEAGYEVLVVQGPASDGTLTMWLLAGIPLDGKTAWIPVDPTSGIGGTGQIGSIPWETSAGGSIAATYISPTAVLELAPNRLPTASFIVIGEAVQQETTNIHSTSQDSDGQIIAYVWFIGETQVAAETTSILHYTFQGAATYEVTLAVYDNRGGSSSKMKEVDVDAEGGCGCG